MLFIATANDLSSHSTSVARPYGADRGRRIHYRGEDRDSQAPPRTAQSWRAPVSTRYEPKISFNKNCPRDHHRALYPRERRKTAEEADKQELCARWLTNWPATEELKNYTITPDEVKDLLGNPPFNRDIYQGNDYAGVVTGLAWTSVGGEILYIETSLSKGKAGKLTLTGNLGDVMKESAVIALEYVKAHVDLLRHRLPHLRAMEHPYPRA